jgi:Kef-type K+ transport system membrane component KefB
MLLLIVLGKFLVWTAIVGLFRYPIWTAIAVAAGLTQIGELSFVVVQVARSSGMVAENVFWHSDSGIDFDIAERFHRTRYIRVAGPKVSRPRRALPVKPRR